MTEAIAHRGPDGEGFFTDGGLGLGHRRLAILDLTSTAEQPMTTPDGQYTLIYNGEVYNFLEIRKELEELGHFFRSTGDTEVVLHALAEWGGEALTRFNGMFALALWDKKHRTLLLARDRYGTKPLYYIHLGKTLLFGSEVKALLAHPASGAEMDLEALLEYFTFQNFFTDRTLFKGVRMLPAGSMLFQREREVAPEQPQEYWDFKFEEPEAPADGQEYLEELDRLFSLAVGRHLVSDVPVGSYLSGGMDTGSIAALSAQQVKELRTFTIGFDLHSASGLELSFDQREEAEFLSGVYGTEHYERVLKAGDMESALPDLVWHLEEPRVGQSYPNYYAALLAGQFNKVVLSGTGADELFAGYPWRYYRAVVNDDFEHYIDKYYLYWQRLIPNRAIREVFRPVWKDVEGVWTRDIFRDVFHTHAERLTRPEDYINHSLYFEAKTFLHGLLVVEDKLSMAHGLETRVPFLDNDLVDFAMRLPISLKLTNLGKVVRINENEPGAKTHKYFEKTRDGKFLLRKLMARYVPKEVSNCVKQGFSGPDASWFRGESIAFVRRTLYDKNAKIYEYLDREAVWKLINSHLEGRENRRLLIWSLLSVEKWCQIFLNKEGESV
jgi:asparagine synthase (glutamine-hydrolysing)